MKRNQWAIVRSCTLVVLLASFIFLPGTIVRAANVLPRVNVSRDGAQSLSPRLAQDPEGNLHVIWDSGDGSRTVRYAKGMWNGSNYAFGDTFEIANVGGFQYSSPNVAVAQNGTIMAAWSASDGVRIKSWNSRDNSPGGTEARLGGGIQVSLAADSQNRFHIAWNGDFQVQYCEWDGARCTKRDAFSADASNRPDIAVDSNNGVHLVWDTGQSGKYRNRPSGGDWNNIQDLGGGNFVQIAADGQGNVHIVRSSGFNIEYCRRTLTSGCTDNRAFDAADDLAPSIGANANGNVVVVFRDSRNKALWYNALEGGAWTSSSIVDDASTAPDVTARSYTNRFSVAWSIDFEAQIRTITVSGSKPVGSITINSEFTPLLGGAGVVGTFDATITNSGGPADKVTLTADGSAARIEDFSDPSTIIRDLSFSEPVKACEQKTIRGTLTRSPGGASDEFSTTAWVDRDVDATATLVANSGDPAYARGPFMLRIASGVDECSGLKSYSVDFTATPPSPDASGEFIIPTGDTIQIPLPDGPDGPYAFNVTVTDKAGFPKTYQLSIIKDTTAPSAYLLSGTRTITTTSLTPDGFVELDLSGLRATDIQYDRGDQDFYSIELVTKLTSAGVPTASEWTARGVDVIAPIPATLRWNAAMGLIGEFVPGEYTVYVRVRDGARNASLEFFEIDKPLQIDELNGRIFLPSLHR